MLPNGSAVNVPLEEALVDPVRGARALIWAVSGEVDGHGQDVGDVRQGVGGEDALQERGGHLGVGKIHVAEDPVKEKWNGW